MSGCGCLTEHAAPLPPCSRSKRPTLEWMALLRALKALKDCPWHVLTGAAVAQLDDAMSAMRSPEAFKVISSCSCAELQWIPTNIPA